MEKDFSLANQENRLKKIDASLLYDVIIIGAGPAGLTASVYCMRKGLKTALVTQNVGGQVIETASIENYTGYRYIEGFELVEKFREQIKQFELYFLEGYGAISLSSTNKEKIIKLEDGRTLRTKTVIITTGKSPRRLNVENEELFIGKGVHFCAICDAPFYKNKNVAVVGGGNSGVEAAIDLAKLAKNVTIIQNDAKLTADKILIEKLNEFKNVNVIYSSKVIKIIGNNTVTGCKIVNLQTSQESELSLDGIFVEIGLIPNSSFVKGLIELNEFNEIRIDSMCRTNIDGIFAAGDVTSVKFKQIIIAGGEGAKAALSAYEYLLKETS